MLKSVNFKSLKDFVYIFALGVERCLSLSKA